MRVVGWHLDYDQECDVEGCNRVASVIVMLDDEITTENRCAEDIPSKTPDPILEIFSKVVGA